MTRHHTSPPGGTVPETPFDVAEFTRSARGSHRATLGLGWYTEHPLGPRTLEAVGLLSRLERGALSFLRSVLVTPTHADARMTAFLVTWAYDKYWLADALELIVTSHAATPPARAAAGPGARLRRTWRSLSERVEPIRESVASNLIGEDVIAVHCVIGALDEWLTQAAYERLIQDARNPRLRDTLSDLLAVKRRHGAFFTEEAANRLGSNRAQSLARRRLKRMVFPLGSRVEPEVSAAGFHLDLVGAAQLDAIDRRVDGLPGLGGLQLARRSAVRAARRAALSPPGEVT